MGMHFKNDITKYAYPDFLQGNLSKGTSRLDDLTKLLRSLEHTQKKHTLINSHGFFINTRGFATKVPPSPLSALAKAATRDMV